MHLHRLAAPALAGVLFLAGCSGDDPDTADAGDAPSAATADPTEAATSASDAATDDQASGFPVTVTDSLGNDETFDAPPERIVSLSPTATEMLFAIGAGEQVVAVDSFSYFPEEAPVTDLSAFEPNVEAVATYDPDLVILSDNPVEVDTEFTVAEIPTLMLNTATSLDDAWAQFALLGEATGHAEDAAAVVADLQDEIAGLVDGTDVPDPAPTYYHELDPTFYSVASDTFIGQIYGLFGLTSIADAADEAGTGYPQLSAEYVLEADPDLIFLADVQCCGVTPDSLAERPGWGELTAVQQGDVVELPADVPSRWGPRIVDFVRVIADAIAGLGA